MAELVIGASLLGLGFLCNKNKKKNNSNKKVSLNEAPSNKNIYESTYSNYTQQQQSQAMNNQYQQSQNTLQTNVVSQDIPQQNNYNQTCSVQAENESFIIK